MKKEPLFKLAEKGRLPSHQFIDALTVRWIEGNRPKFGVVKKLHLPPRKFFERFVPKREWFFEKKLIDSIHGLRHILRVAVYTFLIAPEFSSHITKIENLLTAVVLHDIGRKNDKSDPKHGWRAASWFRKNVATVGKKFQTKFTVEDVEEIYWAILFHELPRLTFTKNKNYSKFRDGIDIVRTADALDRYRLPKIKWWINEKILGYSVPMRFKKVAFDLVVKSERDFLNGIRSEDSVLNILK